ncbi:MAG TPA: hypothetical protein VK981_09215 [Ramlibacter sp.]|nr:hypothetical protein [Ramlibacter sp.]
MFHFHPALWPMLGALLCTPAVAQQAGQPSKAAGAPPAAPYQSAFENYRPYTDEAVRDWNQSNTAVREAGGWRAYARQAQQPAASAPVSPPAEAAPAQPDHAGHHKP